MPENPAEAGEPRTRDVTRTYEDGRIRVLWDAALCIHTGICLQRLPNVFDVTARPWINLDGASAEEIAATVEACPTGALRYEGISVPAETPDDHTTIDVRPNGPLFVRGRVAVTGPGQPSREMLRAAMCRCGASANKPFCDNSHRLIGFRDPGRLV